MAEKYHINCGGCGQALVAVVFPALPGELAEIQLYRGPKGDPPVRVTRCPNAECGRDFAWVTATYLKENLQGGGRVQNVLPQNP